MAPCDAVLVLTTLPHGADGAGWARRLVEARLAACVSVLPGLTSVYRWRDAAGQDVIEDAAEQQIVIKTTADRLEALKAWLAANHPYELPELLVLPAGGGDAYLAWVSSSTR